MCPQGRLRDISAILLEDRADLQLKHGPLFNPIFTLDIGLEPLSHTILW